MGKYADIETGAKASRDEAMAAGYAAVQAMAWADIPDWAQDRMTEELYPDQDDYQNCAEDAVRFAGLEQSGGKTVGWDADDRTITVEWSGDLTDLDKEYFSTEMSGAFAALTVQTLAANVPLNQCDIKLSPSGRGGRQVIEIQCPATGPASAYFPLLPMFYYNAPDRDDFDTDEEWEDEILGAVQDATYGNWHYQDGIATDNDIEKLDVVDAANGGIRSMLAGFAELIVETLSKVWRAGCDYIGSDEYWAEEWECENIRADLSLDGADLDRILGTEDVDTDEEDEDDDESI